MEIRAFPRYMVEKGLDVGAPFVLVSISTTPGEAADIPADPFCIAILRVAFPDRDKPPTSGPNDLFNSEQAKKIWDFVLQHKDSVELFAVHCDMGHCRSPAVAAAVSKVLTGDDMIYFKMHRPNMHVFRTMLETWYDVYGPEPDRI